jgi:hypothetical protein
MGRTRARAGEGRSGGAGIEGRVPQPSLLLLQLLVRRVVPPTDRLYSRLWRKLSLCPVALKNRGAIRPSCGEVEPVRSSFESFAFRWGCPPQHTKLMTLIREFQLQVKVSSDDRYKHVISKTGTTKYSWQFHEVNCRDVRVRDSTSASMTLSLENWDNLCLL